MTGLRIGRRSANGHKQAVHRKGVGLDAKHSVAHMRSLTLITLVGVAAIVPLQTHAQPVSFSSTKQTEEARVLAAEDEYVAAEVSRDETALRQLIDDKFLFNTSRGMTTGKEELIQGVLKMSMVGQTIKERPVMIEENVALVFGTAELRLANPGKPESTSTLRYTATYVNRQGQWRLLALQMQQRAPQ